MLTSNPALVSAAIESGNLTVLLYEEPYDELPGGFGIVDDRLVTCCRDYETGLPRIIVETNALSDELPHW